jgi:hypothetical protein
MRLLRPLLCAIVLGIAGCATVSTHVVRLKASEVYPPTSAVDVLLEKPDRPYTEIALLESRGDVGVSEADLLNDARQKARDVGADAIIRLETEHVYQPPVTVYEPYDPFYWGYYRFAPFASFGHPWGTYRTVGGGYATIVKSLAIKYRDGGKESGAVSGK